MGIIAYLCALCRDVVLYRWIVLVLTKARDNFSIGMIPFYFICICKSIRLSREGTLECRCDPEFGRGKGRRKRDVGATNRRATAGVGAVLLSAFLVACATDYGARGTEHLYRGEYDEALRAFSRVVERDPSDAMAYSNRACVYLVRGEFELAIEDCTKAVELDPGLALAYDNRGYAHLQKGEHELAIRDCTQAIEIDPKSVMAYYNRGRALEARGNSGAAQEDFRKSCELGCKPACEKMR